MKRAVATKLETTAQPSFSWKIVRTVREFESAIKNWDLSLPLACDVETAKDVHLLGVSLAPSNLQESIYVPLVHYNDTQFEKQCGEDVRAALALVLSQATLIGHNFTYDKKWVETILLCNTNWVGDTRIMWHLSSAPSGPHGYGLKAAQKEVLGWEKSNEEELESEVVSAGGKLSNGDHYLASLNVLGHYACLDTHSTIQLYNKLKSWFDQNDYWWMVERTMEFQQLLELGTERGISVDTSYLEKVHNQILRKKDAASKRFLKELKNEIFELEEDWKDRKIASYKRAYNRERYLQHPEEWRRLNLNSDKDKRELFYDKLRLPVTSTTEGGLPQITADTTRAVLRDPKLTTNIREACGAYLKYEEANTLTANFTSLYLKNVKAGRIHPRYNIAGTVSGRLAGFKPHFLNAPFDEAKIMRAFSCEPGYIGIHADLVAIEPTLTAHYSDDPAMLKVFRDGLGDIYLDLALDLFPEDKELKDGYNPRIPVTGAVKERFAKQRKVAKVIQLAVSYTGTGHTVARNLSKDGLPTTVEEATLLVRRYWQKFRRVKEVQWQLKELNRKQGYLVNVCGRIVRVPDPEYKDLYNRFVQSGGHDVLVDWVRTIYRLCRDSNRDIIPVLLDCHDSTSNQVPIEQLDEVREIYQLALDDVNRRLALSCPIKAEIKTFTSLAGLKGKEE